MTKYKNLLRERNSIIKKLKDEFMNEDDIQRKKDALRKMLEEHEEKQAELDEEIDELFQKEALAKMKNNTQLAETKSTEQ